MGPERPQEHPTDRRRRGPWLVGIGASAGGMAALEALLPGLSDQAVYVVAQHMSASRPSLLAEVLSRSSTLPIVEIANGLAVTPGTIHVSSPNTDIEVVDGRFVARTAPKRTSPQPSVDLLLESIAQEAGVRSVGIVLSGTGCDGSAGVRAIRRAGGVTLAQDPVSAAFPQMPQAAVDTGTVDHVLLPEDISDVVSALVEGRHPETGSGRWLPNSAMIDLARETLEATGWDMSDYKDGTLGRQIQRRIEALGVETVDDYVDLVRQNRGELAVLRDSMLIGVTSFFRGADAFDALDDQIRATIEAKKPGETVRAWAAGAGTGEEAYSLAILLAEAIRKRGGDLQLKVYATDLSERAVDTARAGAYPRDAIAGLPQEISDRYFTDGGASVQVVRRLRDQLVFARHDVIRDPPFLRMDVVTCRNVFIYLIPTAQKRAFRNLDMALNPGGLLLLGSAETAPSGTGKLTVVDDAARIYRSQATPPPPARSLPVPKPVPVPTRRGISANTSRDALRDTVRDLLLDDFGPPSIVVDEKGAIVRQFGNLNAIVQLPQGDSDYVVTSLVVPQVRAEVMAVLTQSLRSADGRAESPALLGEPPDISYLVIHGRRFDPDARQGPLILLSFAEAPIASGSVRPDEISADAVEQELSGTREHLRAAMEALKSSNEQTQATNEELLASSEELQTSNEELQATNEELQSTNEELSTVNDTLTARTAELVEINSVLENMQDALNFGLVLVDRHQRIMRFSPLAVRVFGLLPQDIGTPLGRVPRHIPLDDIESRVEDVIRTAHGTISEVTVAEDTYLFQVMPYIVDERVRGAVISLSDITELSEARDRLRRRMEEYQSLSEAVPHVVYRTSPDMRRVDYVSPSVEMLVGLTADEVLTNDRSIHSLVHPADADRVAEITQRRNLAGEGYELDYRIVRKDGSERHVREINRAVAGGLGAIAYRIGTVVDVTDLRTALEDADRRREYFEAIFTQGGVPMATLDRNGNFSDINGPMIALLGFERADVIGYNVRGFVHEGDRDLEIAVLNRAASNPGTGMRELIRFMRPDGSIRFGDQRVVSTVAHAGVDGIQVLAITDLTDLERATRTARRHELQLAGLFGSSPAPMAIMGKDAVFRQCNTAFCELLGYDEEELVGRDSGEFAHPDGLAEDGELIAGLTRGERVSVVSVKRFVTRSGAAMAVRSFASLVPSGDDDAEQVIAQVMIPSGDL